MALRSAGRFAPVLHGNRFRRSPLQRLEARRVHLHNGTVRSHRRFARPQRFPLARIPFRGQCSPALMLRSLTNQLTYSFGLLAPLPAAGSPQRPETSTPQTRRTIAGPFFLPVRPISTPLRECFAPSGSKRSTGCPAVRSAFQLRPIFVRSPQPPISIWLRIIVPDPLRFRRLAVPQTSWNLPQYAGCNREGQRIFCAIARFSTTSFNSVSKQLQVTSVNPL
jgi:hypothetical protein